MTKDQLTPTASRALCAPLRACLDCGRPARGTRCDGCRAARRAARASDPRLMIRTARKRITYDADYRRRRRALRLDDPATLCAVCGQPGTPDDPLTAGHIVPAALDPGSRELQPEHASHNYSAGGRLGAIMRGRFTS